MLGCIFYLYIHTSSNNVDGCSCIAIQLSTMEYLPFNSLHSSKWQRQQNLQIPFTILYSFRSDLDIGSGGAEAEQNKNVSSSTSRHSGIGILNPNQRKKFNLVNYLVFKEVEGEGSGSAIATNKNRFEHGKPSHG